MSVECPQCGAIADSVSVLEHESNCVIVCAVSGCSTVAIRDSYWVRLDDGLRLKMPLCDLHLHRHIIHRHDKPFVWNENVWVWSSGRHGN